MKDFTFRGALLSLVVVSGILSCITDPPPNPYQTAPVMQFDSDTIDVWNGDTITGDALRISIRNNIDVDSFRIDQSTLPGGVRFSLSDGALSGVPGAAAGSYELAIHAMNQWGETADTILIIVHPRRPAQLSYVHHKADSAIIRWTAAPDAEYYRLYASTSADGPYAMQRQITTQNVTAGRLSPSHDIAYFYVVAVSRDGYESKPDKKLLINFAATVVSLRITPPASQTIEEGESFAPIRLDDHVMDEVYEDSALDWTVSGANALIVHVDTSRIATIATPDSLWHGTETIHFTATNPDGLQAACAVDLTVASVNNPPVIARYSGQVIMQDNAFAPVRLDSLVADADHADSALTWSITSSSGLSVGIDATRTATITVVGEWHGTDTLRFIVSDPEGLTDTLHTPFEVKPASNAPLVAAFPEMTALEGSVFDTIMLDEYVRDRNTPDSSITWTATSSDKLHITITPHRGAVATPVDPEWFGRDTLTLKATDEAGLSDSGQVRFVVRGVNDAPVLASIEDRTIERLQSFSPIALDDFVTDDDPDSSLNWSFSGADHITVSIDSARVAAVTVNDTSWIGSDTLEVAVVDRLGLADSTRIVFTVVVISGEGPVVSPIPDQSINEGEAFEPIALDTYVSDINNTPQDIRWTFQHGGDLLVAIDDERVATISVRDPEYSGEETVAFTARDPLGLSDQTDATFTVNAVNDAPTIYGIEQQTIAEGEAFSIISLDTRVTDPDHRDDELRWTYRGNNELSVTINDDNILQVSVPDTFWNGSETITLTVADPLGAQDSTDVTFTVTEVDDPPTITLALADSAREILPGDSVLFVATARDPEDRMDRVDFFVVSGSSLDTVTDYTSPYELGITAPGSYEVRAAACDQGGNCSPKSNTLASSIGMSWRKMQQSSGFPAGAYAANVLHNTLYLAGYRDNEMQYSHDAASWSSHPMPALFGEDYRIVALNDTMYVATYGAAYDGANRACYASTNGRDWDMKSADTDLFARLTPGLAVHNDKLWLFSGYENYTTYVSEDGATWTDAQYSAPNGPVMTWYSFNGRLYGIWGGSPMTVHMLDEASGYWRSVTTSGLDLPNMSWANAVTYDNKTFLFASVYDEASGADRTIVYWTRDGENWKTATDNPAFQNLTYFDAVVFDGKLMIFGGMIGYTSQNDVWYWSADTR